MEFYVDQLTNPQSPPPPPPPVYFFGLLTAAALRDPHASAEAGGSGGGWLGGVNLALFFLSALVYWLEPGGGGAQVSWVG